MLVDTTDDANPTLLWSTSLMVPVWTSAISRERMLLVEIVSGVVEDRFLHVVPVTDDAPPTMDQASTIQIPGATHVMAFDGNTAFVSVPKGVVIVDVTTNPPTVLKELTLAQTPRTAAFKDDVVALAGDTGISLVSPPCPP